MTTPKGVSVEVDATDFASRPPTPRQTHSPRNVSEPHSPSSPQPLNARNRDALGIVLEDESDSYFTSIVPQSPTNRSSLRRAQTFAPARRTVTWNANDEKEEPLSTINEKGAESTSQPSTPVRPSIGRPPGRVRSSPGLQRVQTGVWRMQSLAIVERLKPVPSEPVPGIPEPPHHVFSKRQKYNLVFIVSMAAFFSPLSSNIYFPAMDTIAKTLNVQVEFVALTVTIYMVFQGIAPSFWGPLADTYGRRPIFIATILVYIVANIGLAVSHSYASLMVFRGVQAIGSSATIAIGAGVIGDISVAAERGGFMGLFGGIRMFGQAIGPVLGGALTEFRGFRSIFWFLLIISVLVLLYLIMFLPETQRKIAGDGSWPLYGIYKPLYQRLNPKKKEDEAAVEGIRYQPEKPTFRDMFESFRLLGENDVFVTLLFGAVIYTVWSMITSSTSTLFKKEYHLSDVMVGVIFIPNGLGCVIGSLLTGRLMDWEYKQTEKKFRKAQGLGDEVEVGIQSFPEFPLERARLGSTWWILLAFCVSTGVYGYSTEWHIAVPLVLQFFAAFTATSIFNINSTLMIDLYPKKPATASALNNLVRCTLGAVGVACVEKAMHKIEEGPTFGILAGISGLSGVLVVVELVWGPKWRKDRMLREIERNRVVVGENV